MNIRFLYFEGCPNSESALRLLRSVLDEESVADPVEIVEVTDDVQAEQERFLGSPSIQINGTDIETDRANDTPLFGCRIYRTEQGVSGVPPESMIRAAVRRAVSGESREKTERLRVLFLCTGNSCRSQMAEGWAKSLKSDEIEAYSAGIETHGLNPNAVKVMAEAGVDISGHRCKNVKELMDIDFDYVVRICGHANETCPMFPGKTRIIHVGFDDPPKLAANAKTEKEAIEHYRRVRDEIRDFVETLPDKMR